MDEVDPGPQPVAVDWDRELKRLTRQWGADHRGLEDTDADRRLRHLEAKLRHAASERERRDILRVYYREQRNEEFHRTGEDRRYPHRREMMNR